MSTIHEFPFDPPIEPGIGCRNCPGSLAATAVVYGSGLSIQGLNEYRWVHVETGSEQCLPHTTAQPFDGWQATKRVEAVRRERQIEDDQ
jgi:hypothetical protein